MPKYVRTDAVAKAGSHAGFFDTSLADVLPCVGTPQALRTVSDPLTNGRRPSPSTDTTAVGPQSTPTKLESQDRERRSSNDALSSAETTINRPTSTSEKSNAVAIPSAP
jgi:transposase-like protein